ncbi:hypothetical protein HY639_04195 [Candidatus Woesearchaeota archaeon]|nr:hypothetical protein [Candidatus Woesearchaeota archaeon]
MGGITINEAEQAVSLLLPEATYSLTTLYAAAYAFLDRAYVHLDKKDNAFVATLYPKQAQDFTTLAKAFLAELVNQGYYFAQLEKTQETTKLLVERAFFSTDPALAEKAEQEEIKQLLTELEKDPELQQLVQEIKDEQQ